MTTVFILLLLSVFPEAVQSRLTTFHTIKKDMTTTEALTACRTNYTDLVTLYSEEDHAELVNMTTAAGITRAWIGLYRGQPSDKWSNGDDVTFSSETEDCETEDCETEDCGTEVCCTAMKPDGSWERLNCRDTRPFMCYEEDDSCAPIMYHVIHESKSWYDAQSYCRKNYTDLVSIRDQQQNEEVKIKGGNSTTSFWIGLLRDVWEWRDGGRSAYRNWGTGNPRPPLSSSSPDCVDLFNGKWTSVPCNNQGNGALCSHSNTSVFPPAVQSRFTSIYIIQKKMNQTEAQTSCRTNYTDLVTLYSEEDNTRLFNMMTAAGIRSGWIGLYRGHLSDKWPNGDDVTFSNETGDCGTGVCCTAMKPDGSWERLNCTDTRPFMCYTKNDSCSLPAYHVIHESKSWYDAQSYCRKNYIDLVSIRDQKQNEEVKIKGGNSTTSFWIGLLRDDLEWSDGGRSAYRRCGWTHSTGCVKMSGGKWISAACSDTDFPLCYRTSIHVSNENMSWEKALDYCKQWNRSELLRIENEAEQNEVEQQLRRSRVSGNVWLGLVQSRLFGFWMWTNKMILQSWANWAEGKQPGHIIAHPCAAIDTENCFKWRDRDCRYEYKALCEVP